MAESKTVHDNNNFNNLLVMEAVYATWSSENKNVRTSKTYQREKGGLSEG
jgi:hypothetical protein